MRDRLDHLSRVSRLHVRYYSRDGIRYFVFGPLDAPVKSVCTYPKALMFAEGVALGRTLGPAGKVK
jgi:hypothetical protein